MARTVPKPVSCGRVRPSPAGCCEVTTDADLLLRLVTFALPGQDLRQAEPYARGSHPKDEELDKLDWHRVPYSEAYGIETLEQVQYEHR